MLFRMFVCDLCVKRKKHLPKTIDKCLTFNVIRAGFEPTTHSLEGYIFNFGYFCIFTNCLI